MDVLDYENLMPNYFDKLRVRNAVEDATTCEDIELAAQWLDFQYTDESFLLSNYGLEEQSFTYPEYFRSL